MGYFRDIKNAFRALAPFDKFFINEIIYFFTDDGIIPNNRFPVIHYQKVIDVEDCSDWLEHTFEKWHYVSADLS